MKIYTTAALLLAEGLSRQLAITSTTTNARRCAASCLDKAQYFCANQDFSQGVCCNLASEDCRQEDGICSFDIELSKTSLSRYSVCPFDTQVCGPNRTIQLDINGEAQAISSTGHAKSYDFIFGQLCSYELIWPEQGRSLDQIVLTVASKAEGATLYVGYSTSELQSNGFEKETILLPDSKLVVNYPDKVIITAKASDDGGDSAFEISASFIKLSPIDNDSIV